MHRRLVWRKSVLRSARRGLRNPDGDGADAGSRSAQSSESQPRSLLGLRAAPSLGQPLQAKMAVGPVDDPLEREADAAADRVMQPRNAAEWTRAPDAAPPGPTASAAGEQDALQRSPGSTAAADAAAGTPAPEPVQRVLASPGQPLDAATRALVEPRLGRDFGDVRVHAGPGAASSAEAIEARAYTSGSHIAFASGQYAPHTPAGLRLLSHELGHVVQQSGSPAAQPAVARWPWDEPVTLHKVLPAQTVLRNTQRELFKQLNGYPMADMLKAFAAMAAAGTLDSMIANFDVAEGVNRPRLKIAMDAAKLKSRGTPATEAEIGELKSRMTGMELPPDQQTDILSLLGVASAPKVAGAGSGASAGKSAQATASSAGSPIPAEKLTALGSAEETAFKRQVYNAQMANSKRVKTFFPGLAKDQMEVVEGGQRMRTDAAQACKKLLAKAREDLKAAQEAGDELALTVVEIKAGSAYRDPQQDFKIWDDLFAKYYRETQKKRDELDGGPLGDKAVQQLASYISQYKALPGFSNHTSGIAIDFITKEGELTLGADKSQNKRWKESWFHKWLVQHAGEYGFKPLATEAWHWDYRGTDSEVGRPDSQ